MRPRTDRLSTRALTVGYGHEACAGDDEKGQQGRQEEEGLTTQRQLHVIDVHKPKECCKEENTEFNIKSY